MNLSVAASRLRWPPRSVANRFSSEIFKIFGRTNFDSLRLNALKTSRKNSNSWTRSSLKFNKYPWPALSRSDSSQSRTVRWRLTTDCMNKVRASFVSATYVLSSLHHPSRSVVDLRTRLDRRMMRSPQSRSRTSMPPSTAESRQARPSMRCTRPSSSRRTS